jgi:hypothetical protein
MWLKNMAAESMILRTQFMYQFLCMDANLPPPYLEIHWKRGKSSVYLSNLLELADGVVCVQDTGTRTGLMRRGTAITM